MYLERFATPEQVSRMNAPETTALILYLLIAIPVAAIILFLGWQFMIKPFAQSRNVNGPSAQIAEDIAGEQLALANMQINVSSDGTVTLRTTVNSISEGNRRPIQTLNARNFDIQEKYETEIANATILDTSAKSIPTRIIVLVDLSASMTETTNLTDSAGNALSKLQVAQAAIQIFTANLVDSPISNVNGEPSYIAFLAFSSGGIEFLNNDETIWFPTTEASQSKIQFALSQLNPEGKTPLRDAVAQAISVLKAFDGDRYKLVFSLTDGIDNHSQTTEDELANILAANNIPVVVAGYGLGIQFDSSSLLRISENSGAGSSNVGFFNNVNPHYLPTLFDGLLSDLNHIYEIRWMSSFPQPGNDIQATIKVSYLALNGETISASEARQYSVPSAQE